jgi:hypothetical protein
VTFAEGFLSAKASTRGKGPSPRVSPLSAKALNPVVFRRRGQEGRGAAALPQATGDRVDHMRGRGVPRGRGSVTQPVGDDDRKPEGERGASARGAGPGRGRGRGARDNASGTAQEQPLRRGDSTASDVVSKPDIASADGGKGKRKRTVECVICTADHYTNQCSLLRGVLCCFRRQWWFFLYSGCK